MTLVFIALLIWLLCARVDAFSVAAWGMLVWAIPMLFESVGTPAAYVFSAGIVVCMAAHHFRKPLLRQIAVPSEVAQRVTLLHYFFTCLILVIDRGISSFLAGKYGPTPGQSLYLYYLWNSTLYISFAFQIFSTRTKWRHIVALSISLTLLVISGDRTILSFVVLAALAKISMGRRPIVLLVTAPKLQVTAAILIPVLFFAKAFYGMYAEGAEFTDIIGRLDPEQILYRLEFWHTYGQFNSIVDGRLQYALRDLLIEPLALVPGHAMMGIDPHQFSTLVKQTFYGDWSDNAGVGATFFGEFYAVAGIWGVAIAMALILISLHLIDHGLRSGRVLATALSLAVFPIVVFYVHRNSLAQVSSFFGRYLAIAMFAYLATYIRARPKYKIVRMRHV
jgi:hypothetical protein